MHDLFWGHTRRFRRYLDGRNGTSEAEVNLRILKLAEEVGEVARARIGVVGQNPRKGYTHTTEDLANELCDVIMSAALALDTICGPGGSPRSMLENALRRQIERWKDVLDA